MYRPLPAHKKGSQGWLKDWARQILSDQTRRGLIERPDHCTDCGVKCVPDGHHDNYEKPLDVLWLCRRCHASIHVQIRASAKYYLEHTVYPRAVELSKQLLAEKSP